MIWVPDRDDLVALTKGRPHIGTWSGCGGNPEGTPKSLGSGNCNKDCVNCGRSANFNCCGKRCGETDKLCDGAHFAFVNSEIRTTYVVDRLQQVSSERPELSQFCTNEGWEAWFARWEEAQSGVTAVPAAEAPEGASSGGGGGGGCARSAPAVPPAPTTVGVAPAAAQGGEGTGAGSSSSSSSSSDDDDDDDDDDEAGV